VGVASRRTTNFTLGGEIEGVRAGGLTGGREQLAPRTERLVLCPLFCARCFSFFSFFFFPLFFFALLSGSNERTVFLLTAQKDGSSSRVFAKHGIFASFFTL
jgi:hypothetical protein